MDSPNEEKSPRGQKRKYPEPLEPEVIVVEGPSMVQDDSSDESSDDDSMMPEARSSRREPFSSRFDTMQDLIDYILSDSSVTNDRREFRGTDIDDNPNEDRPNRCNFHNNNWASLEGNTAAVLTSASGGQAMEADDDMDLTAPRNQPQNIESSTMTPMNYGGERAIIFILIIIMAALEMGNTWNCYQNV